MQLSKISGTNSALAATTARSTLTRYAGDILIDPIALQLAAFGVNGIHLDRVAQVDLVVDNIGRMTIIGQ